jgi:hypothetical protein
MDMEILCLDLSFFIYDSDREKETGVVRGLNGGTAADRERENN